jgi:hypothetical protein
VALTRVAKTAAATLTHTFYAYAGTASEAATDSSTTVTVAVTDANGAAVTSGNATHGATGVYTFALPAQAQLAELTVAWSATIAGAAVVETDTVEIVGGFFFNLTDGRASDSSLSDTSKYPLADLAAALVEVEQECEWICDRAFVPRYRRVVLDGSGSSTLTLPDPDVRTIRSVSVAPRAGQTFVALTSTELAALVVKADSTLKRVDSNIWTEGDSNVIVEYEFWYTKSLPVGLLKAAKTRFRSRLNLNKSGIPDRASSFTAQDGGTYRILLPDAFRTGIPEVDAAYSRYSRRVQANAGAQSGARYPASRTLNYDPQRNALYHGGNR